MRHYEKRMEQDLEEIRGMVAAIGEDLDRAIIDSTRAFVEKDRDRAWRTVIGDMPINRATREIDRLCHVFVARHLPTAGVLRYISAVLRLSIALERIGDYAVSVSREAVQLSVVPPTGIREDIEMMAAQGRMMLKQALDAFLDKNAELARGTMAMESQADGVYRKVYKSLLSEGEQAEVPVRDLFAHLVTLNRIERISDQAKNICEEAIFAATGEVKQPKVYRVLFLDERNSGPSLMAESIARKGYPKSGEFSSAGWDPASELDPDLIEFMERHGHDISEFVPSALDTDYERMRGVHVIVTLREEAIDKIPEIPFSTSVLDWSDAVRECGPAGAFDDTHRHTLFKVLAVRVRELMETLRGEQAD